MALALSDLLSPLTADEVMADELAIATTLGLTVTAWQPVSVARAIYQTNAQAIANLTNQMVVNIAAGGFATTAAALPTFTWMDLVSEQVYNVTRIPATQATLDSTESELAGEAFTVLRGHAAGDFHPYDGSELPFP